MTETDEHPIAPPLWASCFGEDDSGIFAECDIDGVAFVWRWIPPGEFQMGSPDGSVEGETEEQGRVGREGPRHWVRITKGFWIGETTVTQAQWKAVLGEESPSHFKGALRPVENVTWEESVGFAERLNDLVPGLGAVLPTEAQWEYGCRAGTGSGYSDGSDCTNPGGKDGALEKLGWHGEGSDGETHEVGLLKANGWGLYDMHGNVDEWCVDGMRDYREKDEEDPVGEMGEDVAGRVIRGGSCWDDAWYCRSAYRDRRGRGDRYRFRGFRLAAGQEQAQEQRSSRTGRRSRQGEERPRSAGPVDAGFRPGDKEGLIKKLIKPFRK